ncbi:hypothetical protein [Neorhodopirellula lusitana]|uniref:hypothetical protein n=1 Tax=Neorhodopirellula lusitana TaxID=445327 RepID=UPI00384DD0CD
MDDSNSLTTTAMERYLARSSHGSGMVFDFTLILKGKIEVDQIRKAWFQTIEKHPRLFAHLTGRGRRQVWVQRPHADQASFVYHAIEAESPDSLPSAKTPLSNDPTSVCPRVGMGARCLLQSNELSGSPAQTKWSLQLQFHHACCDGVGAIRVFGQFAKAYTRETCLQSEGQAVVSKVAKRSAEPKTQQAIASGVVIPDWKNIWTTIRGHNVRLSRNIPVLGSVLSTHNPQQDLSIDEYGGHCRLLFSKSCSDRVRSVLKSTHVNLNDWATAITLKTLAELTPNAASWSNYLMVLNPVETRTWSARHDTHNHIGLAFVRRTHAQIDDVGRLIQSVSRQMQSVRQYGTATEMETGIAIAEHIPGSLKLIEHFGTFTPSATVTCLAGLRMGKRLGVTLQGDSRWIADAEIKDIFFQAPMQSGGEVSIAIWDFDGQLTVSCRLANGLDATAGRVFVERWRECATVTI